MILPGLDENRELTKLFIATSPTTIILTPRTRESDGTGGWRYALGTPRTQQVFSLLEPANSGYQLPLVTVDGEQHSVDFLLLGNHDAVLAEDDVFEIDADKYIIATIMPFNGYERRGMVVKHGW